MLVCLFLLLEGEDFKIASSIFKIISQDELGSTIVKEEPDFVHSVVSFMLREYKNVYLYNSITNENDSIVKRWMESFSTQCLKIFYLNLLTNLWKHI